LTAPEGSGRNQDNPLSREIDIHLDLDSRTHLAGHLWSRLSKGREGASFAYEPAWLKSPLRFPLEPALSLDTGTHHTRQGRSLFGALGDSAPDRWGRMLMKRMERRMAKHEGRATRTLLEIDYLLMVNDTVRTGALRFAERGTKTFLASSSPGIPPMVYLSKLLAASDRIIADQESDDDLQLLAAPGSSLGGARPKAAVTDAEGNLHIAKFPQPGDEYSVERWSYLAHRLAAKAGINVPPAQIIEVNRRSVLVVSRFDRTGTVRIPFLSAMSMLGAADGEPHSYLELVDALRRYGAAANEDQQELWRRVLFSVLISNVDDHLRNHGFLYDLAKRGWRLSPAYDLNPVPRDIKPRYLSTRIDEENDEASFDVVLETAEYYGLARAEVRRIVKETVAAVSKWRTEAARLGASHQEIDRMASAFEHEARDAARAYSN
jgi:serine/threonine-protein kinase HipA